MKNHIKDYLLLLLLFSSCAYSETVVLSVPGPGSISYLPVYLAKAISADKAEGIDLKLHYVPGGPLALRDLDDNNSDFASVGLPAIASSRADGMPLLAIGQLTQSAMFVFMLNSDLKNQVRTIADLKGKRIGTSVSTGKARSMGVMMTGYLLKRAGLQPNDIQYVPAGQDREATRSALASGTVDAMLGDEPFASELIAKGTVVSLADLYHPESSNKLLGGLVVHAALATRENVYLEHPETVRKVQRMFDRTLKWMAQHSALQVLEQLSGQPGFNSARSEEIAPILERNAGMFTERIEWDHRAVENTERFFHEMADAPNEKRLLYSEFVRN